MFFIIMGIFAVVFGVVCSILASTGKLEKMFKQANEIKGEEVYSDENIAKRIRTVKLCGLVAVIAGTLLVIMEVTGF